MTKDSTERLESWRAEISGELAAAKKALPPLETEVATATAAARDVAAEYRNMQQQLGSVNRLAPPLAIRANWHQAEVAAAKSVQDRARAAVAATKEQIGELERALAQIEQLVAPADAAEAA